MEAITSFSSGSDDTRLEYTSHTYIFQIGNQHNDMTSTLAPHTYLNFLYI
jgi:hypothetical protein